MKYLSVVSEINKSLAAVFSWNSTRRKLIYKNQYFQFEAKTLDKSLPGGGRLLLDNLRGEDKNEIR